MWHKHKLMGKFSALALLLAVALWLSGCASGDSRLQGTWKSNKVPMPTEMVKVTKVETVRVRKGSRKTKKVPKTVMIAKTKSAPPYIDLVVKYERALMIIQLPTAEGERPQRISFPYEVAASDEKSVTIDVKEPTTGSKERIQITFDGPNRYWVNPAGGQGWKEYYDRIQKRG